MAISFDSVSIKRSERGLGIRPQDIVADPELRGRRFGVDAEKVARMVESIRAEGQKQNIVIRKLPDGRPAVKAGFTRHEAGKVIAGDDPDFLVWCTFEGGKEEDSFRTTLIENLERNELTDIDHAHNHELLRRRYGKSDAEIASFYRWHPSRISRLKRLLLLPETLQRAVHAGEVSTAAALVYSELDPAEQVRLYEGGVTLTADLNEHVRAQRTAQDTSEESGSSVLDFSRLKTQDTGRKAARTKRRSPQQVLSALTEYATTPDNPAVRLVCSAVLDYAKGVIDDAELRSLLAATAKDAS